jgi:phage-related protein
MSEDLFYNRDRNISGVSTPTNLSSLGLTPVYGSTVSFSSNLYSYETDDSIYNIIPLSVNSLKASFDMKYVVNEDNARKLTNFFESKLGVTQFSFKPDNDIYRTVYGFCDSYAINHLNDNHYEFAVKITVDQAPTLLNWKYMTFLNYNYSAIENCDVHTQFWNFNCVGTVLSPQTLSDFSIKTQDGSQTVILWGDGLNSVARSEQKRTKSYTDRIFVLPSEQQPNSCENNTWSGTLVDWSGNNKTWDYGFYKKYDIVYYEANDNKLNNFFYCKEDHASTVDTSPTGVDSKWTQEFFFEPDIGFQNETTIYSSKIEFKNSHPLRMKVKNNVAPLSMSYKFSNINDKQLKSMLHFLENKAGYRRFRHQIPSIYNRPKVFTCREWSHTWNYFNSHDLEVKLVEDPLGVIPKNS